MQCPRCGSNRLPQYGRFLGQQTYRYGQCHYHFAPGTGRPHQPEQLKARAAALYAEGSSKAASSRLLGIPEVRNEPSIPGLKKSVKPGSC